MNRFRAPFRVVDGTILDADGRKVKLWGVNYYAPFNHNFYNLRELGKDHRAAIDEDLRHFRLMGVDLIRMHLYEREITDRAGHVVENANMAVFDYLVERCAEEGIFLMLAPTVWWNTISNQIVQDGLYAYWHIDAQPAFGFTNYYSCDSLLWDEEPLACQERYFEDLFTRRSTAGGKRLPEYDNVIALELLNEPPFPHYDQTKGDFELTPATMGLAAYSRGRQRLRLVRRWEAFRAERPETTDDEQGFARFRAHVAQGFFDRLWPVVDRHFGARALKVQFPSYNGVVPEEFREVFEASSVDALTMGVYLNLAQFDAADTNHVDHLALARKWFEPYDGLAKGKWARTAYEFDATGTQNGYPLAALAALFARHDVQLAAYFTYTPAAVAAWNPGWLVHYLSLPHTPSRAAGFAAAGEIFRARGPQDPIDMQDDAWEGADFRLAREGDYVVFRGDGVFRHSTDTDEDPGDPARLHTVSGRGRSRFAESDANGCYFLRRETDNTWRLTIFPAQRFLMEPGRGRAFRSMANRYVNCCKEPPVSQLSERPVRFALRALRIAGCQDEWGREVPVDADGAIRVPAGEYLLRVEAP